METEPALRPQPADITLRSYGEADMEFLYAVFAASRDREMALVPHWDEAEKNAFLREQFRLQHSHYQSHYPDARYQIILLDNEPIGRLYVAPMNNEIRLMDVALLAEYRGRGIGAQLVIAIMEEARRSDRFVSLHVEEENRAKQLYERLGFTVVGEVSFYKLMHWIPPGLTPRYATQ
jgi:GNAT superfamily N-acetyltransferase